MHGKILRHALDWGIMAALLATLLAGPWNGGTVAQAQGPMDVDIFSPSFTALPLSVQPGQRFDIGVATAPGATCVGRLTFRNEPTIELEATTAIGGACGWTVDVPPTARPGTGTIGVDIARRGQGWSLAGVLYVNPVGESR
jgi:hypothetical protein